MKLTEQGVEFAGIFYDIEELENIFQNLPTFKEKARKWDETLAHGLFETGHVTLKDYTSALKLRELLEERIKSGDDLCDHLSSQGESPSTVENEVKALRQLLEESQK